MHVSCRRFDVKVADMARKPEAARSCRIKTRNVDPRVCEKPLREEKRERKRERGKEREEKRERRKEREEKRERGRRSTLVGQSVPHGCNLLVGIRSE